MKRSILMAALLVLAGPLMAQEHSYNYVQGTYERIDLDDGFFDIDGDAFGVAGSVEIAEQLHVFGGLNSADFDFDVDIDEVTVGIGYHTTLSPVVSVFARLGYVNFDAGTNGFSVDDDGFGASLGIRARAGNNIELAGSARYIDIDDFGDELSLRGELWYSFTKNFAAGFNITAGDDVVRYGIGGRLYFDM